MTANESFIGYAPAVVVRPARPTEQTIYKTMWENPEYRKVAPGEHYVMHFRRQAKPAHGSTCIDFGCGTGRGALQLAMLTGCKVTMVDFADNCLDQDVRDIIPAQEHFKFVQADLLEPIPVSAKYGYCTDVMEHIPTEDVERALTNILRAAQHVFFAISLTEDHFGSTIGHALHLTVKPFAWWNALLSKLSVVTWAHEGDGVALFYVTGWSNASRLVERGTVNTGDDTLRSNILASIGRGLVQARPYDRQDTEIMILGGGPSLNDFRDEIMKKRAAGMPLVTTNGSYNWAIENGMQPSAQVIVDARAFNKRFVVPHVENCRYFLASQCHPEVFDAAPAAQTMLWHSVITEALCDVLDEKLGVGRWFPVPGGSTVMLRAFMLLRMVGFYRFHVYGFDSCLREDLHHAYTQKENDEKSIVRVSCDDRIFLCHPWMASQAQEFIDQTAIMADEIEMQVYGDGLISHIIKTGAAVEELPA